VASKTHGERIDRLEQVVQILAEGQVRVEKLIADLATETRHGFDLVKQQFEASVREADKRARQTDERMRQTDERMKQTDERIDKLVIAIGEFISRRN
jgi:ElaB/YqjD/DUF883 family membrane-anchored ribosome-binding protein